MLISCEIKIILKENRCLCDLFLCLPSKRCFLVIYFYVTIIQKKTGFISKKSGLISQNYSSKLTLPQLYLAAIFLVREDFLLPVENLPFK